MKKLVAAGVFVVVLVEVVAFAVLDRELVLVVVGVMVALGAAGACASTSCANPGTSPAAN